MRSKQDQTSVKMDKPEAPAVDIEGGHSAITTNDQSEVKGKRVSTRSRVLIGIIITIVVILVIFGIVAGVHPEILQRKEDFTTKRPTDPPTNPPTDSPTVLASDTTSQFSSESSSEFDDEIIEYISPDDDPLTEPITEEPFEIDASLFSSDVTEPYNSIEELRTNIEALAKVYANSIILEQANMYNYRYESKSGAVAFASPEMAFEGVDMAFEDTPAASSASSSESFGGVDDFETYQHEAGVVKNDMVKSNGEYVFTAVDNRIEVWDLQGNLLEGSMVSSAGPDGNSIYIQALLLNPEGSKLIVIASDYGMYTKSLDISVIDNPLQTQVTVFDIKEGSLSEISKTHIDGHHVDSYSVGNNVHVVTRMMLNTWNFFGDDLYRYQKFDGLTNEEYVAEATKRAQEIIPNFVDKVVDLVTEDDDIVLSRVIGIPNSMNDFRSITQVNSFDTSTIGGNTAVKLNVSKSLVLQAGNTGYDYATDDWIWVSDENFAWSFEREDYARQTVLLGFRLDGASSKFSAVGTFPGQLLNQFSIDFVTDGDKEYVRVAVTQNFFQWGWWGPRPMPMPRPIPEPIMPFEGQDEPIPEPMPFEDQDQPNPEPIESESRTLNEIVIFEIPNVEGDIQEYSKLVKLSSIKLGKKDEVSLQYHDLKRQIFRNYQKSLTKLHMFLHVFRFSPEKLVNYCCSIFR